MLILYFPKNSLIYPILVTNTIKNWEGFQILPNKLPWPVMVAGGGHQAHGSETEVFLKVLFIYLLTYSWFTMLCWFQVYNKLIHLYICIYIYIYLLTYIYARIYVYIFRFFLLKFIAKHWVYFPMLYNSCQLSILCIVTYIYINLNLLIYPLSPPLLVTTFVFMSVYLFVLYESSLIFF